MKKEKKFPRKMLVWNLFENRATEKEVLFYCPQSMFPYVTLRTNHEDCIYEGFANAKETDK